MNLSPERIDIKVVLNYAAKKIAPLPILAKHLFYRRYDYNDNNK